MVERLSELTQRLAASQKGVAFTRYAIALACSEGDSIKARTVAETRWPSMRHLGEIVRKSGQVNQIVHKAAVDPATTMDSEWAQPIANYQAIATEFLDVLRPATILGRIQGLTPAPTMTSIPRATAGTSGAWVGEGATISVGRMSFDTVSMAETKLANIVAISIELAQDSRPSAETLIRRDLIAGLAQYADQQFIDPTVAAGAGPASITHGITPIASSGSTVAQITADVQSMFAVGLAAGHSYATGAWIMHPRTALYLGSVLTAGTVPAWPTINVKGGVWFGLPVITSASVPLDTGGDTYIVLLDAAEILVADGTLTIDVSRQASLQMDSAPSNSPAAMISLWQKNLAGLKATCYLTYCRRHDAAVAVLSGVSY